jgi:protein-export SecD/SecF family membrane protein
MAISHANILSTIRTHGQITGSFTPLEVQEMVKKLNAGSLPKKLKDPPISIRAIGPSLGEANRTAGLNAAKWAAIAVAIFMLFYYFYAGFVAVIAVGMNILFIGAMMSTLGATLTLPGIAGLVLAIGMAVDANVLINERIREELTRGTAMRMAIKLGYERAFRAILDSNVTTVLTCVILYVLGSEDIKGFGLTLGIGVFINIFTAYFVTRMFFELMSMFPVPKEIVKYPIVAAVVIAAFGGLLHAGGYFLSDPEMRDQSVMILFGTAMYDIAIAVIALLILMQVARGIHGAFQKSDKPRIPMLRLIGTPVINWVGKRYVFFSISTILVIGGLFTFFSLDKDQIYDIEFLGGTNAQIELKDPGSLNATDVHNKLIEAGEQFEAYGERIATAASVSGSDGVFELKSPGVTAAILDPVIKSVLDEKLTQRNSVQFADPTSERLTIRTRPEAKMDEAGMEVAVQQFAQRLKVAGEALDGALVQSVQEIGTGQEAGESFDIVTRETSKELVVAAIMDSLGDYINVQPALQFHLITDPSKPPTCRTSRSAARMPANSVSAFRRKRRRPSICAAGRAASRSRSTRLIRRNPSRRCEIASEPCVCSPALRTTAGANRRSSDFTR